MANTMSICAYPLAYEQLLGYSTCSLRLFIGYLLHSWSVSHYLDDFFAAFSPEVDLNEKSTQFDQIIAQMGLKKAADKDEEGTTVTHLGFVIDSDAMEVRLSQNKRDRALNAIMTLTSNK